MNELEAAVVKQSEDEALEDLALLTQANERLNDDKEPVAVNLDDL